MTQWSKQAEAQNNGVGFRDNGRAFQSDRRQLASGCSPMSADTVNPTFTFSASLSAPSLWAHQAANNLRTDRTFFPRMGDCGVTHKSRYCPVGRVGLRLQH